MLSKVLNYYGFLIGNIAFLHVNLKRKFFLENCLTFDNDSINFMNCSYCLFLCDHFFQTARNETGLCS